ncbi:hypothetical protein J5690_02360 [bacterium]|nr:hypothetical protein [bacterium]
MKKFTWLLTIALVLVFAVSCGDSKKEEKEKPDSDEISDEEPAETDGDAEPAETDGDAEPADDSDREPAEEPEVDPLKCEDFAEGLNENLIVGEGKDGLARSFYLRLPENVDSMEKVPVIFLYHGYGDTADNFEKYFSSYVNSEEMPFILVAPESRGDIYGFNNIPPSGLDWDMMNLTDSSAEGDMFDALLSCLETRWNIDERHIHVTGFSAGAITADSIALQKSDKVASILSWSGAYFSNPKSRDALGELMGMKIGDFFSWPDFEEDHNKYPQIFVSGEKESDSWGYQGFFTIDFNVMAHLDGEYLSDMGHDVMICNHGEDHTIAGIMQDEMIKFFHDHPFGTVESPYKEAMPEEFAEVCHFFTEDDIIKEETEDPDDEPGENDDDEPAENDDDEPAENDDDEPEETPDETSEIPDEHPCFLRSCD